MITFSGFNGAAKRSLGIVGGTADAGTPGGNEGIRGTAIEIGGMGRDGGSGGCGREGGGAGAEGPISSSSSISTSWVFAVE